MEDRAMRVAVIGGTGMVGRQVVTALQNAGHQAVVVARSVGVDLRTGAGLDAALEGVHAAIDVTNESGTNAASSREAFGLLTGNLLAAERRAGVRHHVLLSIVSAPRLPQVPHYAGKLRQEELVQQSSIPYTILRTTQFHEFAGQMAGWSQREGIVTLPPVLLQPVASADVVAVLIELALGEPHGLAPDLAGPDTHDLVDMARRTLEARGDRTPIRASWRGVSFGPDASGEVFLAGPDARIGPTTFDMWLAQERMRAQSSNAPL
jgi:uncharacterized protein YbjT (DUF2867 family)